MRQETPDDADGDSLPDAGVPEGEPAGTEDVYTKLTRLGRQVARRHEIDEDDADDISQEANFRVFRRKGANPAFSGDEGVAGLGTTTARNLALNYIRDQNVRRLQLDDYETERSWAKGFEGDPLEQLQVRDAFEIAGRTLNMMTARRREICLLSMDGLTNAAIASQLGIHPNTVQEAAALGFARLRAALIDYVE